MSGLGAVLELVHDAGARLTTLEVELRDWTGPAPGRKLVVDPADLAANRLRFQAPGPWQQATERRRRLWVWCKTDRLRVEIVRDRALRRLGVRDGSSWWRWDPDDGASTGPVVSPRGARMLPPLLDPPLLTPARLVAGVRFEPAGFGLRAGREVLLAHAEPRDRTGSTAEPTSYEFEFDAEHGTMLRMAAFQQGQCVRLTEALVARYGVEIDPERFVFNAPDRARVRSQAPPRLTTTATVKVTRSRGDRAQTARKAWP